MVAEAMRKAGDDRVSGDVVWTMLNRRKEVPPLLVQEVRKLLKKPETWPTDSSGAEVGFVTLVAQPQLPALSYRIEDDTVRVPANLASLEPRALMIEDDSVMPALEVGTLALFDFNMNRPRNGYTFLVNLNNQLAVRTLIWTETGWSARSTNPNYEPENVAMKDVLGILVAWYRAAGTQEDQSSDPNGLKL